MSGDDLEHVRRALTAAENVAERTGATEWARKLDAITEWTQGGSIGRVGSVMATMRMLDVPTSDPRWEFPWAAIYACECALATDRARTAQADVERSPRFGWVLERDARMYMQHAKGYADLAEAVERGER